MKKSEMIKKLIEWGNTNPIHDDASNEESIALILSKPLGISELSSMVPFIL